MEELEPDGCLDKVRRLSRTGCDMVDCDLVDSAGGRETNERLWLGGSHSQSQPDQLCHATDCVCGLHQSKAGDGRVLATVFKVVTFEG